MGRSVSARKLLVVLGALFFFGLSQFPFASQDRKPMDSGIELSGRSDKDPPQKSGVWRMPGRGTESPPWTLAGASPRCRRASTDSASFRPVIIRSKCPGLKSPSPRARQPR